MVAKSIIDAFCHTGFKCLYGRILPPRYAILIKSFSILVFALFILICHKSFSQTAYRTTNGHVIVAGMYNDSALYSESHKLRFEYNSVNKTIYGSVNLQSFSCGIDFIDSIFSSSLRLITFNGDIPLDFLTWDHPEYSLDVPLEIKFNSIAVTATANMKFTHVDKLLNYTCILEASFILKLSEFDIDVPTQIGDDINVHFLQLLLRRGRK